MKGFPIQEDKSAIKMSIVNFSRVLKFRNNILIPDNSFSILVLKSLILILFLFSSSFSPLNPATRTTASAYAELEAKIRNNYDKYSVFRWDQYHELMALLSQDKYIALPLNKMRRTYHDSKVVVGIRHDVDFNPFKALEMAYIEKSYGIRATYFFLATAEYYGKISDFIITRSPGIESLFKEVHNTGAEIGIHNDLLTVLITDKIDPYQFNKEELKLYKSLRIPIYGTASHGSALAKVTVPNYQIFSDFASSDSLDFQGKKYPLGKHSLKECGFRYEAYFIDFGFYFSDSGGKWNDPEGLAGILKKLESSKPGDRIQFLVHPDWWGKALN